MPRSSSEERSIEMRCPTHDAPTRSLSEERSEESKCVFHVKRAVPLPRSVIERGAQRRVEMLAAPAHSSPINKSEMRSRAARCTRSATHGPVIERGAQR